MGMFRRPQAVALCAGLLFLVLGIVQSGFTMTDAFRTIFQPASNRKYPITSYPEAPYIQVQPPHPTVDCAKMACLALTFDDGPNPITTPMILDALERTNARASFFVVGSRIAGQEHLIRRMFHSGHEIGNHSWSHGDFTKMSPMQISNEINSTQAAVVHAGVPAPTLFRPPYGAVNATVRSSVSMTIALWNVDPLDWKARDVEEFKMLLLRQARPGGVLDLHDIYGVTAYSLAPAITELQKHYTLVTFSELMNLQPGQPGEFYGR